jgi:hypothetical protein
MGPAYLEVEEEDVEDVEALGLVAIPIAKPPTAPATMPNKAKARVLSRIVALPRFLFDPHNGFSPSVQGTVYTEDAAKVECQVGVAPASCRLSGGRPAHRAGTRHTASRSICPQAPKSGKINIPSKGPERTSSSHGSTM